MRDRSELNEEYQKTILTLLINGIEVPLENTVFTGHIITAWNPYSVQQREEMNKDANDQLLRVLLRFTNSIIEAVGQNKDGTWIEKGFAIDNLEDQAAIEIGRKFGQNAIFKVVNGKSQVVWCN